MDSREIKNKLQPNGPIKGVAAVYGAARVVEAKAGDVEENLSE